MARVGILIVVSVAAWALAGPAAASSGGPGPDSLAVRSLDSPALQSFT